MLTFMPNLITHGEEAILERRHPPRPLTESFRCVPSSNPLCMVDWHQKVKDVFARTQQQVVVCIK